MIQQRLGMGQDGGTLKASDQPTDRSAFLRPGGCAVGVMRGRPRVDIRCKAEVGNTVAEEAPDCHHLGFRVAPSLGIELSVIGLEVKSDAFLRQGEGRWQI